MHGNYDESLYREALEQRARRSVKKGKPAVRPLDDASRPALDELRYASQDSTTWSGAATLAAFAAPSGDFGLVPNSQLLGVF